MTFHNPFCAVGSREPFIHAWPPFIQDRREFPREARHRCHRGSCRVLTCLLRSPNRFTRLSRARPTWATRWISCRACPPTPWTSSSPPRPSPSSARRNTATAPRTPTWTGCSSSPSRQARAQADRQLRPRPRRRLPERTPGTLALQLPAFLIEFLTDPGDTVLDIFAGSNTTGRAAERLSRRWLAFEQDRTYLAASALRFVDDLPPADLATLWSRLHSDNLPVEVNRQQRELVLREKQSESPSQQVPD